MRIGVPREIKVLEGRVGLVPSACSELVKGGHEVLVQADAGALAGYDNAAFEAAGCRVLPDAAALYGEAELIVKVKEPVGADLEYLRSDHLLFCYLHLAAGRELTRTLMDIGLTAVAFETVEEADGSLPMLAPMSDIAGRLSVQLGANLLYTPNGGKGLMLGGVPATERGDVVVLGAGHAGGNAAAMAAAMGASVTVFDLNRERLTELRDLGPNVTTLYPYPDAVAEAVANADLLVGAVLITGRKAPHVVSEAMMSAMRPGGVSVDIAVDQGGCIETTRPTNYAEPTYVWQGIVHCNVTNMPGAVPRTASQALSAAAIPYVRALTRDDWEEWEPLRRGINIQSGKLRHPALLAEFSDLA